LGPTVAYNVTVSTSPKSAPRIRRVTRVIRDIDPWSVFKIGLVFHFVIYLIMLVALVLLWSVASATGTIDNIQQFMKSFGWESFQFKGGQLFVNVMILGLLGVVLATALWVLAATIFNLITDLVGGIRVTVLEEEVVVGSVESLGNR
jgi:hypothetical protein